jgi:hypothetical protein
MVHLHFGDVEVIELPPLVASPQRGNRRFITHRFRKGRNKESRYCYYHQHGQPNDNVHSHYVQDKENPPPIGLDGIGQQKRTIVDFETYEEDRRLRKLMTARTVQHEDSLNDGQSPTRVRRLTRRVRNRM